MATMKEQIEKAKTEAKPLLIEFFAAWCQHCQRMMPIVEELKAKLGDSFNLIQVDVDKYPELAREYRIRAYPTWIIYKDDTESWRDGGEKPLSELEDMVRRVM